MIILDDDNTASVKCFFYCFELILSRTSNEAWPFGKKIDISSAQKTAYLKKKDADNFYSLANVLDTNYGVVRKLSNLVCPQQPGQMSIHVVLLIRWVP